MRFHYLLPGLIVLAGAAHAATHFDSKSWWDRVTVLADDKFEGQYGREP